MIYGKKIFIPTPIKEKDLLTAELEVTKESDGGRVNNVGLWRIIITILEVGAAMVAAKLGFASPFVQLGIGLTGATAHTGLSAANNSLSGIGIAFDYGTAFVPIATGWFRSKKIARALPDTEPFITRFTNKRTRRLVLSALKQYKKLKKLDRISARGFRYAKKRADQLYPTWKKKFNPKVAAEVEKMVEQVMRRKNWKHFSAMREIHFKHYGIGHKYSRLKKEAHAKLMRKYLTIPKKVAAEAKQWQRVFDKIKNLPWTKRLNKSQFMFEINKLTPANKQKFINKFYGDALLSKGQRQIKTNVLKAKAQIRRLSKKLSKRGQETLRLFNERFKAIAHNKQQIQEAMDLMLDNMSIKDAKIVNEMITNKNTNLFKHLTANAYDLNTLQGVIKWIGSARFNQEWVQRAQLIDPNDLGRAPIELLYQKMRKRWEKAIYKKSFDNAVAAGTKNIKQSKNLKQAFIKGGGKLIKNKKGRVTSIKLHSRYLLGIKLLPMGTPLKRWCVVKFVPEATGGATGRNVGGKKDILVTMTDTDFDRLVEEGSAYWFAVGKRKGWFISRGGRIKHSRETRELSNDLSLFLGFVPVPALRNMLSIVSNWVENVSALFEGNYFDEWWAKFTRSFLRSSMNRSARFLSKVAIGSAYKGYRAGTAQIKAQQQAVQQGLKAHSKAFNELVSAAVEKARRNSMWLGRELQRATTTTLTAFQTKDSEGFLKLRPRSAEQLGMRFAKAGIPTSIRSAMIRKERAQGMMLRKQGLDYGINYGRQLVNAKRYLGQVGRVYSAVTPNVAVPNLRSLTRIRLR